MRPRNGPRRPIKRAGHSAVELALLLPFLGLLFLICLDFARLYYHYTIVSNCARNGALYASDPVAARESPYTDVTAAGQADGSDLNPLPTISSTSGTDTSGNPYVEVTASYSFSTISNYPGLSNPINLTRTVRMRTAPTTPN